MVVGGPIAFAAGHTAELYLKAVHTKIRGNYQKAVNCGHDIAKLLCECQAADPRWLPDYSLRRSVVAWLEPKAPESELSADDAAHRRNHHELCMAAKMLLHLKYLGAPTNTLGSKEVELVLPSSYWPQVVRAVRAHLGFPGGRIDCLRRTLDAGHLSPRAETFLNAVLA